MSWKDAIEAAWANETRPMQFWVGQPFLEEITRWKAGEAAGSLYVGADWRRIKRERRKAGDAAIRALRQQQAAV